MIYSDHFAPTQCISFGREDKDPFDLSDIDAAFADDEHQAEAPAPADEVEPEPLPIPCARKDTGGTLAALTQWRQDHKDHGARQREMIEDALADRKREERQRRRDASAAGRKVAQAEWVRARRAAKRKELAGDVADALDGLDGLSHDPADVERMLEMHRVGFALWVETPAPRQAQLRNRGGEMIDALRHVLVERGRSGRDPSCGNLAKLMGVTRRAAQRRLDLIRELEAPGGPWHRQV